jgi:hypothetical protein
VLKALTGLRKPQPLADDTGCQVGHDFRILLEAAGIRPIRLSKLRHTSATLAVAAGVSVRVISDQLGHASISFTLERYSHVLPSIQDEAAARVERMLIRPLASICCRSKGEKPQELLGHGSGKITRVHGLSVEWFIGAAVPSAHAICLDTRSFNL